LNSKARAKSRAAFDKALDARRKIDDEERLERERIEKEKDDQRLVEERKALVHKPTAFRGITPTPEIQLYDKKITMVKFIKKSNNLIEFSGGISTIPHICAPEEEQEELLQEPFLIFFISVHIIIFFCSTRLFHSALFSLFRIPRWRPVP
jgi:hypothetical protein